MGCIDTMTVFFMDGMMNVYGERLRIDPETPLCMIKKLSYYFSFAHPRLGSENEIFKHIVRGIFPHPVFSDSKKFIKKFLKDCPKGSVPVLKFVLTAIDGAGCVEWKSEFEHGYIKDKELK